MSFHRFLFCVTLISSSALAAISPTWTGTTNSVWATNTNWTTPATAPGLSPTPFDTAIFAVAANTTAANTGTITLNTLQFNVGASAYNITNSGAGNFTLAGTGIVNNSANPQSITNSNLLTFTNSADAGSNVTITNSGGTLAFQGTTSANNANIVNNATLNISGLTATNITVGSLTGTGGVTLGANELRVGTLNVANLLSGIIAGVGGQLTKLGTAILTLTGTNTYTGVTTISAGTLDIGNGGATGVVVGNIVDNAALIFDRSNALTYAGIISGSGSVTQAGIGTLSLTGDSNYTGGTTVSAGVLQIGSAGTTGSILGDITNNAGVAFSRTNTLTYPGVISGTGTLAKLSTGTLILTGDNTFTGATTITTGILQIGSGGTSGNISNPTGSIVDNAALTFNRSDTLTYSGAISGTGTVTQAGTGTLILTGLNNPTGATTISSGTLQIGNGGTVGSIVNNIVDNSALVFNRSDSLVYGGVISGTGTLTQAGIGTVILSGANTYAAGTTISAGILQIGNGAATGSIVGNILDNAALVFNRSAALTYAGIISGSGSLTQSGSAALTLTGDSVYTGGTTISAGDTLQLGSLGATGSVVGNITDNGSLIVSRTGTLTYGGVISGALGTLSKLGTGTLILTGNNTYGGLTTITAGTLQLGNGGATGSINFGGNITDNAALVFNRSDTVTYTGAISGTGSLTQAGTGTVILTAANSYAGGTTISAGGTLQIDNGGTTGSITGNVADTGTLIFDRSDALTYAGVISGAGGAVTQLGTGTLIFTGTNTYTGITTISAGTLQLGSGSTTGIVAGNILDNAALVFNRSNALTYAGIISGTGSLTQAGVGILTLTGDSVYTGGTTISAGDTLQIGNAGATGSVVGDITDNGSLIVSRTGTLTYGGVISGALGTLSKLGTGTLILTGNNTYGGLTTITTGTLQLGNGGTAGSINLAGNITDNAALAFNRSDTLTYSGVVSGTGTLTQAGSGTLILTGPNLYTGATIISAGTLQLGSAGTTGSVAGNVTDNGALVFNRSDALTYGGVISGGGSVTKLGANPLTFTGANTYTGVTTISAGTLQIGNGGTTGTIVGNIIDDTALEFNRSNALTYAGEISGAGTVTKFGAGTLTLTGNNTYTGLTTISSLGGTLQIGNGGATGSIVGDVVNDSILTFNRSSGLTYDGVVSGGGALIKLGAGTLTLTGTNIYTGSTTISAGTLQLGNGGVTGLIDLTSNITDNGTLAFNHSNNLIYSGVVSGTGALRQLGSGILTLTNTNTFTGNTTISAGTLQIGNGGTIGSVAGNIVDNTALIFNHSDTLNYGGIISGSGTVTKLGANPLVFTGNNTYTGLTTISAGTLRIGNGGASGAIVGDVSNNGAIEFNRSNAFIYNGTISGPGTFTKSGIETLLITGTNTYTGDTNIDAGTLVLGDLGHPTAAIAGNVNVNLNGGLNGFGTIGGNVINNGSVSPGTSIGTLTVNGDYTQSSIATYSVEVDANGNNDLLNVTGVASLDGTVAVDAVAGGFKKFYPYTIITAGGGVVGQFSNVDFNNVFTQNFLKGEVVYLPNAVQFIVDFNPDTFAAAAQTPNQQAVANYLLATGGTPGIQGLLAMISTGPEFRSAMDQISGATYANQTVEIGHIGNWFEDRMSDRFDMFPDCSENPLIHKKFKRKNYENCHAGKSWWFAAYGMNDQLDGGEVSGLITNNVGFAGGYEKPVNDQAGLGVAVGYTHFQGRATDQEMGNILGDLFQVGVYGHYEVGDWVLGAAVDAGTTDHINASRQIQAATIVAETTANYSAYLFSEQARASYEIDIKHKVDLRPFLGIIAQQTNRAGFTEQGNINFTLDVDGASYYSLRSQLGAMVEVPLAVVKPFALLAWEHEFGSTEGDFTAKLAALTADAESFHIVGTELGSEIALMEAGVVFVQKEKWDLSAFYEGRFANSWQENSATLQLSVRL